MLVAGSTARREQRAGLARGNVSGFVTWTALIRGVLRCSRRRRYNLQSAESSRNFSRLRFSVRHNTVPITGALGNGKSRSLIGATENPTPEHWRAPING